MIEDIEVSLKDNLISVIDVKDASVGNRDNLCVITDLTYGENTAKQCSNKEKV